MDETVFQARSLEYIYDGKYAALRDIDLSIRRGEKIALLGPNGSGKSTLLKLLDGLVFATSGELLAFGRPLTEEAMADEEFAISFRRRVGLVFQDPDVQLFSPTVWDEVAFGPLHLGLSRDEVRDRVSAALGWLDIEKLAQRPPYRLSSGEKKRVALASVLALQPQVLLLDEPTAGLDPRTQASLVDFLLQWHEMGGTLISATQDLSIVADIADRVYILDEDHSLVGNGVASEIIGDRELLLRANLVHQHQHRHGRQAHLHPHLHWQAHDHKT